jgi:hypothetical protein
MYHEPDVDQSQVRQRQWASRHPGTVPCPILLEPLNGLPQIPAHEFRVQSTRFKVLDTTYFFAASIVRARFRPIRSLSRRTAAKRCLHHFVNHPAQKGGHRPGWVLDRVTMQFFVRDDSR